MAPVYTTVIERGHSELSDWCHDFLVQQRIEAPWLDVGCNSGWLLSEVPGGVGMETSPVLRRLAIAKGHLVAAPDQFGAFPSHYFRTAVLGSVLEQTTDPDALLSLAKRLARRVIGLSPIPGGPWGTVGGWVRSVIPADWFAARGCRVVEFPERHKLFFEWVA
jgi:hypothetical protein